MRRPRSGDLRAVGGEVPDEEENRQAEQPRVQRSAIKGGEWWLCPSNRPRRTANKVNGPKACATSSYTAPHSVSAEYLGKVNNSRPDGAFYDIRKGGEYWRCPSNFWRNANKVTDKAACTADLDKHCDSGNVPVGNLTDGYICLKEGE